MTASRVFRLAALIGACALVAPHRLEAAPPAPVEGRTLNARAAALFAETRDAAERVRVLLGDQSAEIRNTGRREAVRLVRNVASALVKPSGSAPEPRPVLDELDALTREFREGGDSPLERSIRRRALLYRASAWLHSWATLSQAVEVASEATLGAETRDGLESLLAGRDGALSHLIRLYAGVAKDAPNPREPLRDLFAAETAFVGTHFTYTEWFDGARPPEFAHDNFVPSRADLLGSPSSEPRLAKGIYSLWSLLYRIVDDYNGLTPQWAAAAADSAAPALSALAVVSGADDLAALGQEGGGDVAIVRAVADRFANYLRFRLDTQSADRMDAVVTAVERARLAPQASGSEPELATLRLALVPVSEHGVDMVLEDARVYARHLLLLGFRRDPTAAGDADHGIEALSRAVFPKLPAAGSPLPAGRQGAPASGFLRWPGGGAAGSFSALLREIDGGVLRYLVAERESQVRAPEQFDSAFEKPSRSIADGLARNLTSVLTALDAVQELVPSAIDGVDPDATALAASASLVERAEVARDASCLRRRLASERASATAARSALERSDSRSLAQQMSGLSVTSTGVDFSVAALPTRSFKDYEEASKAAIERLKTPGPSAERATQEELRSQFLAARARLVASALRVRARRLGEEIARLELEVARQQAARAELDRRASQIETQIAEAGARARVDETEAARVRLALAERARQVAAAQVEALEQALGEARTVAVAMKKQLEEKAAELRAKAQQIREENGRGLFVAIAKAIVNIVAAILSPITGGASLAVAALVNKGLDFYKAGKVDWGDLASSVVSVTKLDQTTAFREVRGFVLGAGETPGKVAADLRAAILSARWELNAMSEEARRALDSLRQSSENDLRTFFAYVAAGMPFEVKDGKLKVPLGIAKLEFKDPGLERALHDLLAAGGVLAANVSGDANKLLSVAAGGDSAFRGELAGLVGAAVHRIDGFAQGQVDAARERLQSFLQSKDATIDACRLVARCLAEGSVVLLDGDRVVALTRPVEREFEALQARLQALALKTLRDSLSAQERALKAVSDSVSALQRDAKDDPAALEAAATKVKNEEIPKAEESVSIVQSELTAALERLEQEKGAALVANYEAQAAEERSRAAVLATALSRLHEEAAGLAGEIAGRWIDRAELVGESAAAEYQAEVAALRAEEFELQQIYSRCLRQGVDPLSGTGSWSFSRPARPACADLLDSGGALPGASTRQSLSDAVRGLLGMLSWAALFRLPDSSPTSDGRRGSADVASRMRQTYREIVAASLAALSGRNVGADARADGSASAELERLHGALSEMFKEWVPENVDSGVVRISKISADKVRWTDSAAGRERTDVVPTQSTDAMRELGARLGPQFGPYLAKTVGVLRFRMPESAEGGQVGVEFRLEPPLDAGNAWYYADCATATLVAPGLSDLYFLLVPPESPLTRSASAMDADPGLGVVRSPASKPAQASASLDEKGMRDVAMRDLGPRKRFALTGCFGDWTVLLLSSRLTSATAPAARDKVVRDFRARMSAASAAPEFLMVYFFVRDE